MYSEYVGFFLNFREGSFKNTSGEDVSYFKVTVCDKDGNIDSFSVAEKDRNVVRKQCGSLSLFSSVTVSLFIKGKGQYMKAYAENIEGKEA